MTSRQKINSEKFESKAVFVGLLREWIAEQTPKQTFYLHSLALLFFSRFSNQIWKNQIDFPSNLFFSSLFFSNQIRKIFLPNLSNSSIDWLWWCRPYFIMLELLNPWLSLSLSLPPLSCIIFHDFFYRFSRGEWGKKKIYHSSLKALKLWSLSGHEHLLYRTNNDGREKKTLPYYSSIPFPWSLRSPMKKLSTEQTTSRDGEWTLVDKRREYFFFRLPIINGVKIVEIFSLSIIIIFYHKLRPNSFFFEW